MTERIALLAAIEASPADDTPRLAYADWLGENGSTDLDRATAEFVRVACQGCAKKRQTPEEGRWLAENWRRLVPGAVAHPKYRPQRHGRWVHALFAWPLASPPDSSQSWTVYCHLEFWRGFLRRAVFSGAFEMEPMLAVLMPDQPLTEPDIMVPCFLPDQQGQTLLTRAEMGKAFDWVDALAAEVAPHSMRFIDPTGEHVKRVRRAAFRASARSLSPLLISAEPQPQPREMVA